jgi:hypothetical protein
MKLRKERKRERERERRRGEGRGRENWWAMLYLKAHLLMKGGVNRSHEKEFAKGDLFWR